MAWDQELDKSAVAYKIASAMENRIRVIAGPGTGKSYAMKRRVARLLEEGVPPGKMLAVTFHARRCRRSPPRIAKTRCAWL